MKSKYYPVVLSKKDKKALQDVLGSDGYSGQTRKRASILLALDESLGGSPEQTTVAEVLKTSTVTIYKTSKAFYEGGIEKALERKERKTPPVEPKVTGELEARVIQIACSAPPPGRARWTVRLIEDTVRVIDELPDVSYATVFRILKKHHLSLT